MPGAQFVFRNQTASACPGKNKFGHIGEQPDSMPTAWHNPLTNTSSLIAATAWGTYASKGNTLDHVTHDCSHKVFTEVNSSFPSTYTNHQWLQATRMSPDGSGQAIIHNEFHGEQSGNLSYCSYNHKTPTGQCILWSTDLGHSFDGGETWTTTTAPVFALPREYVLFRGVPPPPTFQLFHAMGKTNPLLRCYQFFCGDPSILFSSCISTSSLSSQIQEGLPSRWLWCTGICPSISRRISPQLL